MLETHESFQDEQNREPMYRNMRKIHSCYLPTSVTRCLKNVHNTHTEVPGNRST